HRDNEILRLASHTLSSSLRESNSPPYSSFQKIGTRPQTSPKAPTARHNAPTNRAPKPIRAAPIDATLNEESSLQAKSKIDCCWPRAPNARRVPSRPIRSLGLAIATSTPPRSI